LSRDEYDPRSPSERADPRELLRLLAQHLGVDLDVLVIASSRGFGDDRCMVDWHQQELARELDAATDWLQTGAPVDPHENAHERTVRLLAARRDRARCTTGGGR
jgi:hypothetical protein